MFFITLIFLIILCIGAWLLTKWYKMKKFWVQKGIPHCPVHPVFGSLTFLQKINPNIWLKELYKQYQSPYVSIWIFWRPGLIVNCPTIARNILVKDADIFRNRLLGTGTKDELGTLNLFTVNDPLWSSIRKRLTTVFTAAKLRSWHDLYHSKANDLVHRIKSDNEKGIASNLKTLYADYTTDIIGESSFGIKCEATKNNGGPLRAMTEEFEKYSVYRGIEWSCIFFFPELADLLGFTFWPKHTMIYFRKIFNMIVQERGGYEKVTDGKRDLMDALLKMKQDAMKDDQKMDEVILLSNALMFLQAGYETSSSALAYFTYELAYHPKYQKIVYEELVGLKSKIGDREFEARDLAELPYFNGVIKETLRKYHITKLFPDPEEFRPERFLPENERDITPYTYLPFGEGPRFCIGKRFGMSSLRYLNLILKTIE